MNYVCTYGDGCRAYCDGKCKNEDELCNYRKYTVRAVLLLDKMPEYCGECPCYDEIHEMCRDAYEDIDRELMSKRVRPDWCDLKKARVVDSTYNSLVVDEFRNVDIKEDF